MRRFFDFGRPVDIRALAVLAALLTAIAITVRGCFIAAASDEGAAGQQTESASSTVISVYDAEKKKTVSMELEEYILHVTAAEMPASFEAEALKAQSVAARTYTLRRMELSPCGKGGADVCTDSACCQAYKSDAQLKARWGDSYDENLSKLRTAVFSTAGEALIYDGEPIEALYHSDAGGMTESAENVFRNPRPYLVSVSSPDGDKHDQISIKRRTFVKKVNAALKKAGLTVKNLEKEVEVLLRFESGRVEKLRLGGQTVTGREFRKLMGLESANFTIEFSSTHVVIATVGYGHGVGMSQYGANAMAAEGALYPEILSHYYPGAAVERHAFVSASNGG